MTKRVSVMLLAGIAAFLPLVAPLSAHADVKIVQERTLTGLEELGAKGIPGNYIYFYKGDKLREEYEGRSIVHIYDCAKDRFYTLNRTDHTYSVRTLDEVLKQGESSLLAKLKIQGTTTITEGGSTRTIADHKSSDYAVQMTMNISDQEHGARLLTLKMEGQQWTTETIPFPSKCPNISRLAYLFSPRASRLLKPYLEKVGDMKGMPLSFDYIINLSGIVNGTFEAHADVKSVSTAPIPDYMFKIPPGYTLVDKVAEED